MDTNTILKLSPKERYTLLKDDSYRKYLFEENNHYQFIWLVQGLKESEILNILDDDIILLLSKDSRKIDKLNGILTCGNPYINEFLKKENIIKMLIDCYSFLHYYMDTLDISFAREYFKYLTNNNLSLTYLEGLNSDCQYAIIKENIQSITAQNLNIDVLSRLHRQSIEFLLEDPKFQNILLNARVDQIDIIVGKNVRLPSNLINSKELIDKYLEIENINKFHAYVSSLEANNTYLKEITLAKRRERYTTQINNFNRELNIFNDYLPILEGQKNFSDFSLSYEVSNLSSNKDKLLEFLKELTITKMLEMTVDTFYQDLTYNFLKNVESIVQYALKEPNVNIPKERLEIYKLFLNYYNIPSEERIKLYNLLNDGSNHMSEFYDDFQSCKVRSYNEIKNSLIDLNIKEKKTSIDGLDIYTYDGEPFKMLVSKVGYPRESMYFPDHIWWERNNKKVTSLSLISDKNITTFGDPNSDVILGFSNFNPANILITYHADAYTDDRGSQKISKLYTPDELIDKTKTYNEIQISEKYEYLHPSYVVCYDNIKEGDIRASKLLGGIPLVVINTQKYTYKKDGFISPSEDRYISSFEAYQNTNYRKK